MLKKLFIKNYKNVTDPYVRNKYGIVSGTFGITTNIILFIIKLIIGFCQRVLQLWQMLSIIYPTVYLV